MDISTWLHQILTGSPLPTLLGLQIYPVVAPQGITGYYAVYQTVNKQPILTQENDDGTRVWDYQFLVIGPSFAGVAQRTEDLRNFLTGYSDRPVAGIMRIIELDQRDLPPAADTRAFIRLLEVNVMENLT